MNKKEDSTYRQLLDYAFWLLGKRSYPEALLKKKLYSKEKNHLLAEQIISRLKELGYIDDQKFTLNYIKHRINRSPRTINFLTRELTRKGIEKSVIQNVLPTIEINEQELCMQAISKKETLLAKSNLPHPKKREKMIRFLLSRGFQWETIKACLNTKR